MASVRVSGWSWGLQPRKPSGQSVLSENKRETTGSTGRPLLVPEEVGQTHPLGMLLLLLPVPQGPRAGRPHVSG